MKNNKELVGLINYEISKVSMNIENNISLFRSLHQMLIDLTFGYEISESRLRQLLNRHTAASSSAVAPSPPPKRAAGPTGPATEARATKAAKKAAAIPNALKDIEIEKSIQITNNKKNHSNSKKETSVTDNSSIKVKKTSSQEKALELDLLSRSELIREAKKLGYSDTNLKGKRMVSLKDMIKTKKALNELKYNK